MPGYSNISFGDNLICCRGHAFPNPPYGSTPRILCRTSCPRVESWRSRERDLIDVAVVPGHRVFFGREASFRFTRPNQCMMPFFRGDSIEPASPLTAFRIESDQRAS